MANAFVEKYLEHFGGVNGNAGMSRNTAPTVYSAKDIYKRVYQYGSTGDSAKANELLNLYDSKRSDASSPYYNPYYKATSTQAIEGLRGLGVEIPKNGVSQDWIDSLKPFADYSNTSVSGSLKAPARGSTVAQDMAYWLYQLENDEITTREAEAEWDEMQREIGLYVKMGYSDDDIIRKIDMSNYKTLSKMDESLSTKVPVQTTRGIGYSKDAMYGAIWAARNDGGTGDAEADFMNYAIGIGNAYTPDPKSEAALDATSEWFNPYGRGTVSGRKASALAIEYGVTDFSDEWLNEHKDWLNDSEKADVYRDIQGYVQLSKDAEAELQALNVEAEKKLKNGKTAEEIVKSLNSTSFESSSKTNFEQKYPTLAKMEKARTTGAALDMGYSVDFAMPYFVEQLKAKETEFGALEAPETSETGDETGIDSFRISEYLAGKEAAGTRATAETALSDELKKYAQGVSKPEELSEAAQGFLKKYGDVFAGELLFNFTGGEAGEEYYDIRDVSGFGDTASHALKAADDAAASGLITLDDRIDHMMTVAGAMDEAENAGMSLEEYLQGNPEAMAGVTAIEGRIAKAEQIKREQAKEAKQNYIDNYVGANHALYTGSQLTDEQIQILYATDASEYTKDEFQPKAHAKYAEITVPGVDEYGYEIERETNVYDEIDRLVAEIAPVNAEENEDDSVPEMSEEDSAFIKNIVREQMLDAFERDLKTSAYFGYDAKVVGGHQQSGITRFYNENPKALSWLNADTAQKIYADCASSAESFFAGDESANVYSERVKEQYEAKYTEEVQREAVERLDDEGIFYAVGKGAEKFGNQHAASWAETVDFWILRRSERETEAFIRRTMSREQYREYIANEYIPNIESDERRAATGKKLQEYTGDIYDFGIDPSRESIQNYIERRKAAIDTINNDMLVHLSDSEIAFANVVTGTLDTVAYGIEAAAASAAFGAVGLPAKLVSFGGSLVTYGMTAGAQAGNEFLASGASLGASKGFGVMIGAITAGAEALTNNFWNSKLKGILPDNIKVSSKWADAAIGKLSGKPKVLASFGRAALKTAYALENAVVNAAYQATAESAQEVMEEGLGGTVENIARNLILGESNPVFALDGLWDVVVGSAQQMLLLNAVKLPGGIKKTISSDNRTARTFAEAATPMQKTAEMRSEALETEAKEIQAEVEQADVRAEEAFSDERAQEFEKANAEITVGDVLIMVAQPNKAISSSSRLMMELEIIESKPSPSEADINRAIDAAKADIADEALIAEVISSALDGEMEIANESINALEKAMDNYQQEVQPLIDVKAEAQAELQKANAELKNAQEDLRIANGFLVEAAAALDAEETPGNETVSAVTEAGRILNEQNERLDKANATTEMARKSLSKAEKALADVQQRYVQEARAEAYKAVEAANKAAYDEWRANKEAEAQAKLQEAAEIRTATEKDIESAYVFIQAENHYSDARMGEIRRLVEKHSGKIAEKLQTSREKLRSDLEKRLSGWKVTYAPLGETIGGSTNAAAREIVLNSNASLDELNAYVTTHELTHYAEQSGLYDELAKSVLDFAYGTSDINADVIQAAKADIQNEYEARTGQALTDDAAIHEMVAKAVNERVFRGTETGKWVQRLVKGDRNLALRLYDWAADQVHALYLRIRNKNGEGRDAANAFKRMRELQKQFETVLDDAGVEYEKHTNVGGNNELLYSMLSSDKKATPTEKDLEVIRNMPAQSISNISDEEASALSAFANRSYQELEYDAEGNATGNGIKSPFFRRIFGDWRAYEKTTVPVTVVNESKIDIGDIPRGSVINNDTGWNIAITRDAIDKTINENGKHSNVYKAMKDIDSVLSNAILVDTQTVGAPSAKLGADSALMHIFYAPIKAQGSEVNSLAKLYVSEKISGSPSSKKFYLIKAEKMSPSTGGDSNVEDPNTKMAAVTDDKYTVSEIYKLVKSLDDAFQKKSEKKIRFAPVEVDLALLNEDGTPKLEELKALASETAGEQLALLPDRRTQRQLEALALAADEAKAKGDTAAWQQIMDARQSLIETTGVRYEGNNPVRIAEKLAVALGGKVYTLKNEKSAYFDQHSKAIVVGNGAASALSNTMQALGEQIAEMPEIQAVSSGVDAAQFFFRYMTTGNKSLSAAEEAYRMQFEKALSEAGKLKDVQLARAQMLNYINSTAAEKVETFITERYKPKTGIRAWLNQKLTENLDRTRPAQLVDAYAGGNALSTATAYLPYAKRMADRMFDEVMTDADGNEVHKGLGALFEETGLQDKDYKLLRDYLLSKHGLSRIAEGKPIFLEGDAEVDLDEAQMREVVQMVEGGAANNQQYKRVLDSANALHSWWNAFMDTWVVGEGRLSEEDAMRMRKTYPYYVPTFREGYGIRLLGGELSDTGSKRRVYDPISSMQSMITGVVNQVQQNRAARVFDEIYQRTPGLGWIAQETEPKVETIETEDDDGMRSFETKVTRPSDPGTMEVIRADGSRAYYNIADEGLYNLLSGSGAKAAKTGLEMVGRATRMMAKLTTELNLTFGAKNAIRDIQHSINYGSWASNYTTGLLKWLPTFVEVARGKSETFKSYKAMGGGEWERYATNTRPGTRRLRRALTKSTGLSGALRRVSSIPEIVLKLNEWSELTSRYVEYKYGKHDLSTPEGRRKAFMAAQEATVDFQRGGDSTLARFMRQVVPFFNATVQGGYQQARMFTGAERERLAPRLAKTLVNNALMGALSAGMVYALGTDEDKEKYANLSESAKNGYMIFPLFGDAEFMHALGRPAGMDFIRLPLGQDALAREAYVFGNSLTDILMGDYENGVSELASDLWGVTKDILANALPASTILQPVFDVQANESFYGSPIVRESTRQNEHWTDWNDSTTPEIFKTTSDLVSRIAPNAEWAAPAYLEYMAGQWTGWLGQSVLNMLSKDYYTGEAGGMRAIAENFHKAFLFDSATTTDVRTEFDKRVTAIDRIAGMTDAKTSELKPGLSEEEAKEAYIAANDLKNGALKYVEEQISEKYDEIRQVNEGEGTDFEKEARVAQLYDEIVALEKQAVSETEGFWKKYVYGGNLFASRAYIPEVSGAYLTDEIFRSDYEDGAEYMTAAEAVAGLPGNENSTTIYPNPKYTFTAKDENGVQKEYTLKDAKAEAEFDEMYREYYMDAYESLMDSYPGFWGDEYSDAERTTLWKKLHTHAQKMAQAEMRDNEAYEEVK